MAWLDPPECLAARDCLERGNPTQAAQVLLGSKYARHREVRKLLVEAGTRLVEVARQQHQAGELETAAESIQWAERCMALGGEALGLREAIGRALREREERRVWLAGQLDRGRDLAEAGRLHSALDVLAPLAEHAPAAELRTVVEQRLASFARHVDGCRECLAAGEVQAAHRHWQQARRIMPEDPQLAELAAAIARGMSTTASAASQPAAVTDRSQRFALGALALVVSAGEVCLGTPRAEGVHVPIQGPLHRRHAVLFRDRQGWQLAACRDARGQPCPVRVGGQPLDCLRRLADGDLLQLGNPHCVWRFSLPIADSATALLEAAPGTQGLAWAPAGELFSRVVLLDEKLVLRGYRPAHLVLPELACNRLLFRWRRGQLQWQAEGGAVRVEIPGRTVDQPLNQVYLPSRLIIEPHLDEAELLGRTVAGCEPFEQSVLELADPWARLAEGRSS